MKKAMVEDGKKKNQHLTLLTIFSVNLMTAVSGMAFAWSSPSVPQLRALDDRNPLPSPATTPQIAWITSLHNLGSLFGPLTAGFLASHLGQKRTLVIFSLPQLLGNIVLTSAGEVWHFYVARFLLGVGTGCVFSIVPGFVAEVADASTRGRASIVLSLNIIASQLFVYVVGPYVTIGVLAAMSLVPSLVFLLVFGLLVPETEGKQLEAEEIALRFEESDSAEGSWKSREVKRALRITLGLMFFQQFNGQGCIAAYMQTIFDSSAGQSFFLSAHQSVMVVGAVQLAVTIIVAQVADRVGRKTLLGGSYLGQLLALTLLGAYFHLKLGGYDLGGFSWLPLAAVLLMLGSFKLGSGPVSWTVAGEVFPPAVKYYMNSLVALEMTVFSFVTNLLFPLVVERCGMGWTVCGFAGVVFMAVVFVVYVVPETRGKSLEEIQVMLRKGG